MDSKTGVIMEGTDESLKQIEKDLSRELIAIGANDIDKIRGMSQADRGQFAKEVKARRRKNKAARAARRKNRK